MISAVNHMEGGGGGGADEEYVLNQMLLRLGRKRTLAAMALTHPSDLGAVQSKTLLNTIASTALLARILSPLWSEAASLARICKRFAAAIKHSDFWMPAVRAYLRNMWPRLPPAFVRYVNPFFRFPPHMHHCPPWPWHAFLMWLFYKNKQNGRGCYLDTDTRNSKGVLTRIMIYYANSHALTFMMHTDETYFETTWYTLPVRANGVHHILCNKTEATLSSPLASAYNVVVNGTHVWTDGPVLLKGERSWCGAVEEQQLPEAADGVRRCYLVPKEGLGKYNDE